VKITDAEALLPFVDIIALTVRWRCREDIDVLRYSPDGQWLAVGSHDGVIDLYKVSAETRRSAPTSRQSKSMTFKESKGEGHQHHARYQGHSSYITQLDWSRDSKVLQSNCGAYEILYWDLRTGQQMRSSRDNVEAVRTLNKTFS